VTPGNRAAAVVAGFNVIVFSLIAYLALREKLQKKRNNQVEHPVSVEEEVTAIGDAADQNKALEVQAIEIRNA
jgi:MFS transporter, ACS family, pantothenate transporter